MLNYRVVNAVFFPLLTITTLLRIFVFDIHWIIYLILITVYLFLNIYGSFNIAFNYYLKSICKADTDKKIISLTFDDGPDGKLTPVILDILKRNDITATFFVIGEKAAAAPEIIKKIDNYGNIIGNHSYHHSDYFDFIPIGKMIKELNDTQNIISNIINKKMTFFRPPFGVTNPLIRKLVRKTGVTSIGWSLRSYDTKIKERSLIIKRIKKVKSGDILLFHDNKEITTEILQDVIDLCRSKGFKFVNLDELIKKNAYV
jgi:peptidoglycan/xylan/chitin deacetylase (PgdA/CDA1 family)